MAQNKHFLIDSCVFYCQMFTVWEIWKVQKKKKTMLEETI